jgi:dihydrofolate reductase
MSISVQNVEQRNGPRLTLVVARARNGVIGRDGDLPWRLKADLAIFKKATMGKPMLMGRKTWESLPRVLPGRPHLVLTRDPGLQLTGATVFTDFQTMLLHARAIAEASRASEIAVIGGEALFALALPLADRLYVTEVEADVPGDARFPQFNEAEWVETARERHEADTDNEHAFVARVLRPARSPSRLEA